MLGASCSPSPPAAQTSAPLREYALDLKEVLLMVLVTYGWLGSVAAAVAIFACILILRWRERFYQQEMTRVSEVKNQLMQGKLELPLKSSVEKGEQR